MLLTQAANGTPLYLRNLATARRSYQHPARFFSYYSWSDSAGKWHRGRAITVSTEMKKGEQIDQFGTAVEAKLAEVRRSLPADLVIGTTSDQKDRSARKSICSIAA